MKPPTTRENTLLILLMLAVLSKECSANLPPVFSMDMNNLAISEKTPVGSVIYTLEGSDPENGTVYFDLQGTDVLRVNRNTGDVTVVKPLDHETNDTLNVIVSIEDEVQGGRNNIVEVPVTVIILDENDNAPDFQNTPYDILVPEDAPVGTTIFSDVAVTDRDSAGANIEVECINLPAYEDACDLFDIETTDSSQNSYSGAIRLRKGLNYTTRQKYQFLLKSTDGELSSTINVTVNVGDVQDTPPRFIGDLTAEVDENATINTLVMTFHAEDGDKGVPRKILYELINNPMNYFLLDAITGELRTARPLDKEAVDNSEGILILNVKAHELIDGIKGNDPLTVTNAEAVVKIRDINDEPPSFNKREYFVQVPENIAEGSPLPGLDMYVTDPDEGNNSAFSLQLDDLISGSFSIEPEKAIGSTSVTIRVKNSSLDYEDLNQRKFIMLVVAKELYTEEKLSSTATITMTVSDINDNAPTFDQETYSATISEMSTSGTLVTSITAKDRDSGKFGENGIIYHLAGSGSELFAVNNRTGTVSVAECEHPGKTPCLDFEDKSEYQLQFIATDDDGKGQTKIVPLKITLTDNNDNPPMFSQSIYRVFVNEGAVRFDPDLIVEAKDADKTSHVTYAIIAGNDDELFSIDSNSGKIRISSNKGLDASNDTDNVLVLTVLASDGKFTTTSVVNITVKDVNNNSPIFTKESYLESVAEDIPVGSTLVQLEATDMDSGPNSEIEYQIQKGAYEDFKIDGASGVVTVASKLDFDRRNTYNIEVVARDHGEPVLTGTTTLTVNVINTNDKMPYFTPATQKTEVMEDATVGTVVHTLIALDPDVNSSEALNFAATEPITALDKHGNEVLGSDVYKNFFSVDKNTGKVTVLNPLLRDVAAVVRITLLVTDITAPSVQQGQGLLIVTITDVNDSPPRFLPPWSVERPVYDLELKEEQPVGTIVSTFKATDDDSDIAGYAIIPESEHFQINNGTGIIQIKKQIDYERTKQLNFTIVAFDAGIPQLNATATVVVLVVNLNDNDPIFSAKSYNASVYENSANGSFVARVKATDLDEGDYGRITYSLAGEHSENFAISPDQGDITVANSNFFDHEIINETVLQVVASDGASGNLKRSVTVPVNVKILDINDNAPKFNQSEYNVTVIENVRLNPPMPLVQVNATDEDSGINGNIHYSIIGGNDNDIFLLGVETGILYPHKSLLGQNRDFRLTIEARDGAGNGQLYDRAKINVQVLNVNEHEPVFKMPLLPNATVEVTENAATENYLVMTVIAADKDENENGKITYHFKVDGQNVQQTNEFAIDANTGELRARMFLDREVQSKYELVLVARDHGYPKFFETLRYLTVLLVDINDNRPEFPDSKSTNPYHFYVTENERRDMRIGQVKALDKDEGNHARVYYYILAGNEDGSFYLDRSDGSLYTNKSFDREDKDEYNLFILANNDPDFYFTFEDKQKLNEEEVMHDSSIAKVLVTVTDVNDNPPIFEQAFYYAAVNAMTNINDFVTNVTAFDPDLGANGTLTYYIKASNLFKYGSNKSSGSIIPSPFNITEKGMISTATYLAENNQHRFIIDIIARENAYPEREAYSQVHVWIFEPEQLIRVILSRPTYEVRRERDEIVAELSNATQSLVIIDDIRYHTDDSGYKNDDWSDMYILVVDRASQNILPVPEVLKIIDSKYDFLKDYYAGFAIENVVPAFVIEKDDSFDPALAALIALVIVLVVGIITFIIVCCCLRHWVISPTDLKKKDALIKKAIIDDLNTTENPLWIEQKLKIYEEQELTMQVFNEPEQNPLARRNSDDLIPDDNTYATIQHPNRRGSAHMATMSLADDLADYATLSGLPHQSDSTHSSLRGAPNYYEAAMGFQGSTFQVPDKLNNDYDSYRTRFKGSELTINHDGQPEYVAELI